MPQLTDLALSIIKDGATYPKRLELARAYRDRTEPGYRVTMQWFRLVQLEAMKFQRHFDVTPTAEEVAGATIELILYYKDHVKEVDGT